MIRVARELKVVIALLFLPGAPTAKAVSTQPSADMIVQRSIEALKSDWQAEPKYDYHEVDVNNHGSRAYEVMMLLGSPYNRVEAINGTPQDQSEQQRKLDAAMSRRCTESKGQTRKRVAAYNNGRERNHLLMKEMANAFVFTALGETTINGHEAWHLRALPKPGYQPLSKETKVLTGMEGELWIDKETYQWIQVVAQVTHPVSIAGFLARVEPGTKFKLVQAPVTGGVWLPSKFSYGSKVRVLSLIGHTGSEDETYSDYQAADSVKIPACSRGAHSTNVGD